jgi:hypothetical protein
VSAQRFREEQEKAEEEGDESADAGAAIFMSREEAEAAARDEKPAGAEFKRIGTERSIASEIIEQKKKRDVEEGKLTESGGVLHQKHSLFYLFKRMGQLNSAEKWRYLIAFLSAVVLGMVYPVFSIVFGNVIGVSFVPLTLYSFFRNSLGSDVFAVRSRCLVRQTDTSCGVVSIHRLRILSVACSLLLIGPAEPLGQAAIDMLCMLS